MDKGFGIAALITVLLGLFVPIYGIYITLVGIALAVAAALYGDRVFCTATALVAGVGVYFFSPVLWLILSTFSDKEALSVVIFITNLSPFIAIVLHEFLIKKNTSERFYSTQKSEPVASPNMDSDGPTLNFKADASSSDKSGPLDDRIDRKKETSRVGEDPALDKYGSSKNHSNKIETRASNSQNAFFSLFAILLSITTLSY